MKRIAIRHDLSREDSGMRRFNNYSVSPPGRSNQRAGINTTGAPWFFLLLAAIMMSGANAERVIESSKSVGMTTTAWVLALVSTLVSFFAMCFVIVYRKNKIVTVGQPLWVEEEVRICVFLWSIFEQLLTIPFLFLVLGSLLFLLGFLLFVFVLSILVLAFALFILVLVLLRLLWIWLTI